MNKVKIYEYQKAEGKNYLEKVAIGSGIFHQWGVDYEEFENGTANYSTAIIEMPDGSVKNVPVELIVFGGTEIYPEVDVEAYENKIAELRGDLDKSEIQYNQQPTTNNYR